MRSAPAIVGMAALWLSLFKQLLYPVLYAYYRTGNEAALLAQGVYSVTLVAVVFVLLVAHSRLHGLVGRGRWLVVALGFCGAAGIALRMLFEPATETGELTMCIGGALSAAYVPVHITFWLLYVHHSEQVGIARSVALSFALFLAVYALLTIASMNNMYVSIACPAISAAMALACPRLSVADERLAQPQAQVQPETTQGETEPQSAELAHTEVAKAVGAESSVPAGSPSEHRSDVQARQTAQSPAPSNTPELPVGFAEAFELSEREAELAAYAHRNLSARRIAGELFIAESTVYTHLKRIYRKTDVHSKHELIELIDSWQPES